MERMERIEAVRKGLMSRERQCGIYPPEKLREILNGIYPEETANELADHLLGKNEEDCKNESSGQHHNR